MAVPRDLSRHRAACVLTLGGGQRRYRRWRECRSPSTGTLCSYGTTGNKIAVAVHCRANQHRGGGVVRSANLLKRGLLLEAAATMRSRACCCDFSIACRSGVDPPDHPSSTDERPIGE